MLKQRILTAMVLFILVAVVLFVLPPLGLRVAVLLLCLLTLNEIALMYKFVLLERLGVLLIFTAICLALSFVHLDYSLYISVVSIALWCFAVPLILIFRPERIAKMVLWLLSLALLVPAFYSFIALHELLGAWQLVSIMAIAWIADIGAYFVGRAWGKYKLAPQISPGKTIEGALGGFMLTLGYLFLLKSLNVVVYLYDYRAVVKFAIILTLVSIIGDLFESWLKRTAGVKDSGTLLPGHGGVFDRIDSLLAVVSITFVMIRGLV